LTLYWLGPQSGKETRYIQYAAGEIDKAPNAYCTTTDWYETSHSK